jgi:hypothetical protein
LAASKSMPPAPLVPSTTVSTSASPPPMRRTGVITPVEVSFCG